MLQQNLIEALLDFLRENYEEKYSDFGINKVYKSIYREHDNKHKRIVSGVLVMDFEADRPPLLLKIDIAESKGLIQIHSSLLHNSFQRYAIKNQTEIDLSEEYIKIDDLTSGENSVVTPDGSISDTEVATLNGFLLRDKIYLRNQNKGSATAIAAYLIDSEPLFALVDYRHEMELPVAYDNTNIFYQKMTSVTTAGMIFYINPLHQEKEIEGEIFDEYEINGISINDESFFETINNICSNENFNIKMGLPDHLFIERLIEEADQSSGEDTILSQRTTGYSELESTDGPIPLQEEVHSLNQKCPYILPEDNLLSGINKLYFFVNKRTALGFSDRGLFSAYIYRGPSEDQDPGDQQ